MTCVCMQECHTVNSLTLQIFSLALSRFIIHSRVYVCAYEYTCSKILLFHVYEKYTTTYSIYAQYDMVLMLVYVC